jgi:signal transduction histidine kinase
MTVKAKLRGAFALYIALLTAVLVYHVRTIRRSVDSGRELTTISARYRVINDQAGRVADISRVAEKYLVTRDSGYFARFVELAGEFGGELRRLSGGAITSAERERLTALLDRWRMVEFEVRRLTADGATPGPTAVTEALTGMEPILDAIGLETTRLGHATQSAMAAELERSERSAQAAERIAWGAAALALLLSLALSALLVRSIVRPLGRLAKGTREISEGRLGFRLDEDGGDELAQVAREFNAMSARLAELDRMKREFASNVSHDLKTPLSSMQEATSVMLDELPGPITPKQRHLLSLNLESGRRLSSMIAKLLEISRLESMPVPAEGFETVDLTGIARGCVERAAAAAPRQGPTVVFDEPEEPHFVRGNFDALVRVVDNLLENAVKFSPADGTVRVSLAARAEQSELSVSDEGPGVPDADKARVFERFYQTPTGRAVAARGVGLGLAICKRIVETHGGTIRVEDNEPRGAVFLMLLPATVRVEAPEPASAGASA